MNQKPSNIKEAAARAAELIRQLVLSAEADQSFVMRDVVRQVLGPIMAAHRSGIGFEKLSEMFGQVGLELAPSTLRRYYFELKAEDDLAKQAERGAAQLLKAKQILTTRTVNAEQRQQLDSLMAKTEPAKPAEKNDRTSANAEVRRTPRPPLAGASPAPSIRSEPVDGKAREKEVTHAPTSPAPARPANPSASSGNTIDEIEEASNATEERSVIVEDLKTIDGKVFWSSGAPFTGTLSKKQIMLLRTSGRIIAPTVGHSSKDFVPMRPNL